MDESPLEARHTKAKDNKGMRIGMEGKGSQVGTAANNQLRKSPIDSFFDRDGEAGNTGMCVLGRAEGPRKNTQILFWYAAVRAGEVRRRCTFAKLKKVSSLTRPYGFRWNRRDAAGMRLLVLCLSR